MGAVSIPLGRRVALYAVGYCQIVRYLKTKRSQKREEARLDQVHGYAKNCRAGAPLGGPGG